MEGGKGRKIFQIQASAFVRPTEKKELCLRSESVGRQGRRFGKWGRWVRRDKSQNPCRPREEMSTLRIQFGTHSLAQHLERAYV